ncbi:cytochrome P450- family 81- subfamily D-polypeptide 5 [Striga hermonthica]|uniref:Cytochrome P450- family 81- subfamily D-polypeptide 5 n=1 Tax=Striga hermonthica TaxID=68872 RepID=A0A9N7R5K6_STRHE|nr:cytochrome P450- family 81- subfamily D-polypeptide 5 [Striga hermonthica]
MLLNHHPPTPFPNLPLIGHIYFLITRPVPLHRALAQISCRRGAIVLLQLGSWPVLLISSPSAARDCLCLSINDAAFADRPDLLNGRHFGYGFTSLAWAPYGHHWRNLRRISALELLSSRRLNASSGSRAHEARALVTKLAGYGRGPPGLQALFFEYAYCVVKG